MGLYWAMEEALYPGTISTPSMWGPLYGADETSSGFGEIQITTALHQLTPCQTVGMSQTPADHPLPTSTPTSQQISPRLSPQPPHPTRPPEENNPGITSRPHGGPCQAFAFIAVWTRGKEHRGLAAIWGSRGWGVWSRSMPHKGRSGREN